MNDNSREAINKAKVEKAVRRKAKSFAAIFSTSDGQVVLEALRAEFCSDELRATTPHDTYYNLGRRDTVVYIEQMIKFSERKDEDDDNSFDA